jgi:hypothetical protein
MLSFRQPQLPLVFPSLLRWTWCLVLVGLLLLLSLLLLLCLLLLRLLLLLSLLLPLSLLLLWSLSQSLCITTKCIVVLTILAA